VHSHFVRVGVLGHVGRFSAVDSAVYPRGARVICRTARGLEVGEVLSTGDGNSPGSGDGDLLRGMTVEDELLWDRIGRNRESAFEACTQLLGEHGVTEVLMDVEHLFDGQSIFFYFLGEPPSHIDELSRSLTDTYEAKVQFRKFAETVTEGCGPGCGTEEATGSGCGTSGCSTCSVATACGTKRSH
jgi:cell fate regulator YaaT (PSP1 superfamily)